MLICKKKRLKTITLLNENSLNKFESGTQVKRVLNGFTFVYNDTKTSAGGVGIYIKLHICFKLRQDLEIKCRDYESIWIEIIQNSKTNVIGVIYRHPNYNFQKF